MKQIIMMLLLVFLFSFTALGTALDSTQTPTIVGAGLLEKSWQQDDIGEATGEAAYDAGSGSFSLSNTGYSVEVADNQNFVYFSLFRDGEIVARVSGLSGAGWAGVQFRENLSKGAAKVSLKTQLGHFSRKDVRRSQDGHALQQLNYRPDRHSWLKLVRSGDFFIAYSSADGVHWKFVFQEKVEMSGQVFAGIFVENHGFDEKTRASLSNIMLLDNIEPLQALNTACSTRELVYNP